MKENEVFETIKVLSNNTIDISSNDYEIKNNIKNNFKFDSFKK